MEANNRGMMLPVDAPVFRWGGVAAAVLAMVLMVLCNVPETPAVRGKSQTRPPPRRHPYKRDLIVYSLFLSVSAILAFFFLRAKELIREWSKDPEYPQVADLPIALYSFALLSILRMVLLPRFAALGRVVIPKEKFGTEHETRVQRFAGQLFKFLYHTLVTVLPIIFLRNESWWPPGHALYKGLWDNHPHVPAVKWLREFYMFQIGYYLHAMALTLVQRTRANYVEMAVHHVATLTLLICSYFIQNNVRHGTVVLWIHDVCDVPVCLTRLVVDLPYALPTAISYVWLMVSWAYFRLWVYPTQAVYIVAYVSLKEGWVDYNNLHTFWITTTMLVLLVFMHIKWFYELLGMASVYFRTGKRCDSTDAHAIAAKKIK